MSIVAAVGTDTYGGLSGYKRPVAGNPTRIPSNLPAFRGTPNTPGQPIKTPAIKSSANHPDRKTNVLIPYARVCPVEFPADLGRTEAGDVIFVSKTRPGVPGYAHARESRVCGVDALNRWMAPMNWRMKNEMGQYRYILRDPTNLADDWRKVPILQEWTLDGICLSNDEKNLNRASMSAQRDGQLWNIGIQGPCMINNGYVEEHSSQGGLMILQQGQVARQTGLFSPGYMDHRVERFGENKVTVDQQWDFAADYDSTQYHTYPMQMFNRKVCPLHELYVGLVATKYSLSDAHVELMQRLAAAETLLGNAEKGLQNEPGNEGQKVLARKARNSLKTIKSDVAFKDAFTAKTAYAKMGWWDDVKGALLPENGAGDKRPDSFAAFRYVLFTSAHMYELLDDNELDTAELTSAERAADPDNASRAKRRKVTQSPFNDWAQREKDFKNMVGAWHLGKVLDVKAGKMPYFEGGPIETGYRLTINLSLGWCDWRALRRKYTPGGSGVQIGEKHALKWEEETLEAAEPAERYARETIFQWPTVYDEAAEAEAAAAAGAATSGDGAGDGAGASTSTESTASIASAILSARLAKLPPNPTLPGVDGALRTAQLGIAHLEALLAPVTAEELAGNGPSLDIANFVTTGSSARTPARTAASAASSASAPPIRRRAGNTPEASPDRTGVVAPAAPATAVPVAAVAPAPPLAPVIEAPSAPAASTQSAAAAAPQAAAASKKRRSTGSSSEVFSSIFGSGGDTGAAPQPLNPAHRSEGAAGASSASTGRSYQRRGKGGSSGNKD